MLSDMSLLEITSISASWERRTWLDASIWLLAMALVAKKLLSSSKYRKPGESIGAGDPSLMALVCPWKAGKIATGGCSWLLGLSRRPLSNAENS